MTELQQFTAQRDKLSNICDEHGLVYGFRAEYPMKLTIRPNSGMDEQLSMLEAAGDVDRIPQDAYITIVYAEDGIKTVTDGGFPIGKALRSKIENIFEKMCRFWSMHFYRTIVCANTIDPRLIPEPPVEEEVPKPEPVTADEDPLADIDLGDLSDDFMGSEAIEE